MVAASARVTASKVLQPAKSFRRLREAFGPAPEQLQLAERIGGEISSWCEQQGLPHPGLNCGSYLLEELGHEGDLVAICSGEVDELLTVFREQLSIKNLSESWAQERDQIGNDIHAQWQLITAWVDGFSPIASKRLRST